MSAEPQADLVSIRQAAALAGVSIGTMRGWAHNRTVRAFRVVGRLRVDRASVLALVKPLDAEPVGENEDVIRVERNRAA